MTNFENASYSSFFPYRRELHLGWWGFLDDAQVRRAYADLAQRFPLSPAAINLYVGPNTTRERHPLMRWPDAFTNGSLELLVRLAAKDCR